MRWALASILGLAVVFWSGCAGYHLGPASGAVSGEKSIEIFPFNNQTLEPRLGDAVTQALREKDITGFTLIHVGTDLASADRQSLSLLADDLARNITLALTEGGW
jgi:hypothetical protein